MKKVSVIVPLYNTEQYIERCLKSICAQTYKNLEIIVVNDCSTDSSAAIVERMAYEDNRIQLVTHQKNRGLYHARITGVEKSTGDYIDFVDSDDYISCDFIRTLVYRSLETEADVVVGKAVHEDEKGYRYFHNLYHFYDFGILNGKEILKEFWRQEGKCFIWHTVWNKLYAKEIWEKALPVLKRQNEHLIMTEDFAFSAVLLNYASRLASVEYGAYFYFQHGNASTSLRGGVSKFIKNIGDLKTAFNFVHSFIRSSEYKIDAEEKFKKWSDLYRYFWMGNIDNSQLGSKEKTDMKNLLERSLKDFGNKVHCPSYFYSVSSEYDNRYDDIVRKATSDEITCVSFDIFDTAVVRPFYKPSDVFVLLNQKFSLLFPEERRKFSDIRIRAEKDVRDEKIYCRNSETEDISLDDIYEKIKEISFIPENVLKKMKVLECENEIKFCRKRESIYNVYKAALHCGKKIYFTSDMYLEKDCIEKILNKCDYSTFTDLLVSCVDGASKRTGRLYKKLISVSEAEPISVFHIGDNWETDFEKAYQAGLAAVFFPSTLNCIQYNIPDIKTTHSCCPYTEPSGSMMNMEKALEFFGTRCALAVAANRIYDNPFIGFNEWTEVNSSPVFIGYYALGMHLLGFTKWFSQIIDSSDYKTVLFIARDGYLPMKAYEVMSKYYKNKANIKYLYTSRKAAFPCGIKSKSDIFSLFDNVNKNTCTPNMFLNMLSPVLEYNDTPSFEKAEILMDKPFANYSEFCKFARIIADELFNPEKCKKFNTETAKYFSENISEKTVCVDIGYSGRTQEVIKNTTGISCDAFYVHLNDGNCCECERKNGFKVYSYYDFTPSVTGGAREVLFSEYIPSCIGYINNSKKTKPVFEEFEYEYAADYVINEIQKNAVQFISDYCEFFGEFIDIMDMRSSDVSYPYEYFLHTLTDADSKMFDCFEFEDDMWAGKTQKLSDYWKECIRYHKVIPYYLQGKERVEYITNQDYTDGNLEYKVYIKNGLDKKNLVKKAMYWYAVDKNFFKRRVQDYRNKKK